MVIPSDGPSVQPPSGTSGMVLGQTPSPCFDVVTNAKPNLAVALAWMPEAIPSGSSPGPSARSSRCRRERVR